MRGGTQTSWCRRKIRKERDAGRVEGERERRRRQISESEAESLAGLLFPSRRRRHPGIRIFLERQLGRLPGRSGLAKTKRTKTRHTAESEDDRPLGDFCPEKDREKKTRRGELATKRSVGTL